MRRKTPQEITIEIMKNHHGVTIDKLICGKYAGIGRVLDTGYACAEGLSSSDYDADNPTGYNTGQWITVQVIEGAMGGYHKGDTIERIWSYGGDTGIIGKPQTGDIIGFYYAMYAELWEKLSPEEKKVLEEDQEKSKSRKSPKRFTHFWRRT